MQKVQFIMKVWQFWISKNQITCHNPDKATTVQIQRKIVKNTLNLELLFFNHFNAGKAGLGVRGERGNTESICSKVNNIAEMPTAMTII